MDGVAVAERFRLWDEAHLAGERSGSGGIGGFITGADDHGDFTDAGGGDFLRENGKGGFRNAILIYECLKRESALVFSGGGDDGFGDFHGGKMSDSNRCCNTGGEVWIGNLSNLPTHLTLWLRSAGFSLESAVQLETRTFFYHRLTDLNGFYGKNWKIKNLLFFTQ
jgi:hypothetical protein